MQRWLEVQVEGLKRENQQLRQTNIFSQNLLQSSKKQLELMEEKERELKNLVPLLQQASTLIECASVARIGLSANFNHMEEFFHSFRNSLGQQESTTQLEQNSHSGFHHIRQISTETQASSRLSSEISDFEVELEQPSSLIGQALKELSACITATYPPDDGDGYDHLEHKVSKDRVANIEDCNSRPPRGSSPHILNVKEHNLKESKDNQSQSLKPGERKRKVICPTVPGSQAYFVQGDELRSRLERQRKKIESRS